MRSSLRLLKRAALLWLAIEIAVAVILLASGHQTGLLGYGLLQPAPAPPDPEYPRDAELGRVASIFAMRPVGIECPTWEQWSTDPIGNNGAIGYTWGDGWDFAVVGYYGGKSLCAAARAIKSDGITTEDRGDGLPYRFTKADLALAVMVLVHESYHLRMSYRNRHLEYAVQCKAIRHWRYAVYFLGGSEALATRLWPYAWREHQEINRNPVYRSTRCKVPPLHR